MAAKEVYIWEHGDAYDVHKSHGRLESVIEMCTRLRKTATPEKIVTVSNERPLVRIEMMEQTVA